MPENLEYQDIEFVDLLHTGSAIATAVARTYLIEKKEDLNTIVISSSGVLVSFPKKTRFNKLTSFLDDYLTLAVQNKLVDERYARILREGKNVGSIKELLGNLREIAVAEAESKFVPKLETAKQTKAMYAKARGLVEYDGKEVKRTGYIITMSDLAYDRAKQINSGINPQKRASIISLKNHLSLPDSIPDLSFAGKGQYEEIIKQITEAAPKALEKILT